MTTIGKYKAQKGQRAGYKHSRPQNKMQKREPFKKLPTVQKERRESVGADYLLYLPCDTEQNRKIIEGFIKNLKPAQKVIKDMNEDVTIEQLEKISQMIFKKYNYRSQGILGCYDSRTNNFFTYYVSIMHRTEESRRWIGDASGVTLWEVMAKMIIKTVDDIYKERAKKDAEETQNLLH